MSCRVARFKVCRDFTSAYMNEWFIMEEFTEEKINQLESEEAAADAAAQAEPVAEEVVEEMTEEEAKEASENLNKLEQKRSIINNDAEKHKRLRDELNKQTKEWVAKRDALNAEVRRLVEEAGKYREERDALNQQVKEQKALRDEKNKVVSELTEAYHELRKTLPQSDKDKDRPSIKQLKKEFSDLENRQQTQVLKKKDEENLIKRLKEIDNLIKECEGEQETSGDLREKSAELRAAKVDAENCHKMVSEFAEKAQKSHDQMIALYEQADALRKQADEAQAKFIECKKAADEEHRKHIEQIKSVHETDGAVNAIKSKQKNARKKKSDADSKKAADDIFARFKNGEKLSTEDLMALQKSGYL